MAIALLDGWKCELSRATRARNGGVDLAYTIAYFLSGFLLAGFSEVLSPLFCAGLLVLYLRTHQRRYLVVTAGILFGTAIVLLAPGNAARAALLPPRVDLVTGIRNGLNITGQFILSQIVDRFPALLLAFCVGYLCPLKVRVRRKLCAVEVLLLVTIGVIFWTLFLPLWAAGGLDSRHFTFASFAITVAVGMLGVLCAEPVLL